MRFYKTLLIIVVLAAGCTPNNSDESCTLEPALYQVANFPIGCAVDLNQLEFNPHYAQLLGQQFNQLTPENIFKADALHPGQNQFNFLVADRLVAYAEQENKSLHGHTLIWHQQLPPWMKDFSGTRSEWEAMFKNHIQTICSHFKGKVRAWDVVNEVFNEDGSLRQNIWLEHLGPSYIEKAFRYAHAADPEALLFINDYNLALSSKKQEALYKLVDDLRKRGVPIHGIGLQMHISIAFPSDDALGSCIEELAKLGLAIHLSEVDISINPYNRNITYNTDLANRQARKLAYLLQAYQRLPESQQYGITFWGLSDLESWIPSYFGRNDAPLLFDRDYQVKPVYCQFKKLLP
jgi:endo-1,4-beta-xylanase